MKKSSTILYVINTMKVGGAAKMLKFAIENSKSIFDTIYLITTEEDEDIELGENVIHIKKQLYKDSKRIKGLWRLKEILNIRKIVKEINPEITCAFISDIAVTSRLATLGCDTIFVSAERGDPYTLPMYWNHLVRFSYRCSDYCIFQTELARDYFTNSVREKSVVIPNPYISTENSTPYFGERNKTIVSAGRFSREKGFDLLIKAFTQIQRVHNDYKLIIYGEGIERSYYDELVEELGIKQSVIFPGYVKDLPLHIRKEGIFVLSSYYEGIPNVMIEAMSVAMPVIATDCTPGGPRFLTNNGERGILVPVGDVDAISNAIDKLISNPELSKDYATKALEITSILDSVAIKKKWIDFFELIRK